MAAEVRKMLWGLGARVVVDADVAAAKQLMKRKRGTESSGSMISPLYEMDDTLTHFFTSPSPTRTHPILFLISSFPLPFSHTELCFRLSLVQKLTLMITEVC